MQQYLNEILCVLVTLFVAGLLGVCEDINAHNGEPGLFVGLSFAGGLFGLIALGLMYVGSLVW